jgi:predicted transcriptional regulator
VFVGVFMSGRRSRFEIYVDILKEIKNGSNKPTQIMYGANLSWRPLQDILESLVGQGLIEELEGLRKDKRTRRRYILTSKGENVVRYYSKAKSLVEISSAGDPSL